MEANSINYCNMKLFHLLYLHLCFIAKLPISLRMIPGRIPKLQHPKKNLQAKENRAMGTHGTFPQPPGRSYSTYAPSCHSCSWNSVVAQVTWKHKNVGSLVTKQRSKHQKKGHGENLPPGFSCFSPHLKWPAKKNAAEASHSSISNAQKSKVKIGKLKTWVCRWRIDYATHSTW